MITDEELRSALTAYVNVDKDICWGKKKKTPSLKRAALVHARGNFSAVTRYWRERIEPVSGLTPAEVKRNRLAEIDNLIKKKMGNPDFCGQNHFTESQCDTLKVMVVCCGQMGFPFQMTTFSALCQGVARQQFEAVKKATGGDKGYDERLVSQGGDIPDCGERWYRT